MLKAFTRRIRPPKNATGWLLLAAIITSVIGLLIVISVSPWPFGEKPDWVPVLSLWSQLELTERMNAATLVVGALGLLAAVLAIGSGIAELHHVLPTQRVVVEDIYGVSEEDDLEFGQEGTRWTAVRMVNPDGAPIINSFRFDVQIVSTDTLEVLAPPPPPPSPIGLFSPYSLGLDIKPTWRQSRDADDNKIYSWTRGESFPWFPNLSFVSPKVELDEIDGPAEWRVTWWTDRAGPVQEVRKILGNDK